MNGNLNLSKQYVFCSIMVLLLTYFVGHTIYGSRGLLKYLELEDKIEKQLTELDELKAERLSTEHKVTLLRPGSIDKDLLEERSRDVLGYSSRDELVITNPENDSSEKEKFRENKK
jgi:cell division protein FtsB